MGIKKKKTGKHKKKRKPLSVKKKEGKIYISADGKMKQRFVAVK